MFVIHSVEVKEWLSYHMIGCKTAKNNEDLPHEWMPLENKVEFSPGVVEVLVWLRGIDFGS